MGDLVLKLFKKKKTAEDSVFADNLDKQKHEEEINIMLDQKPVEIKTQKILPEEKPIEFPRTDISKIQMDEVPNPPASDVSISPPPSKIPKLKTIVPFTPLDEGIIENLSTASEKYVKLNEYNVASSEIIVLDADLKAKRQEINDILFIKNNFDSNILKLHRNLEDMHRKLMQIQRTLFKTI